MLLVKKEQAEVYNLLVKYTGSFSLRDEIDTCQNIEVDLQVYRQIIIFIRPFHVKDKKMIDKVKTKVDTFRQFWHRSSNYIPLPSCWLLEEYKLENIYYWFQIFKQYITWSKSDIPLD